MSHLEKSLKFIKLDAYMLLECILRRNYSLLANNVTSLDTFALMDSGHTSMKFINLIQEFVPEYEATRLNEMYPFNYRKAWVFERNMMLPKFQKVLASLYQSGLYFYWEEQSNFDHTFSSIRTLYKLMSQQEKSDKWELRLL